MLTYMVFLSENSKGTFDKKLLGIFLIVWPTWWRAMCYAACFMKKAAHACTKICTKLSVKNFITAIFNRKRFWIKEKKN